MRPLAFGLGAVLIAGLLVAETAMDLSTDERTAIYLLFGVMALFTFVAAAVLFRLIRGFSSLRASLVVVAMAAVFVAGCTAALAAMTMFIEPHDLQLILVAVILGVGLGGVVAGAVARPLTRDLEAITDAAERLGEGDLGSRTGVSRQDELGRVAEAFDGMARRLESAEAERQHLLASISHDLRTPLASMQAAVEALQDGLAPDPPAYLRGLGHDLDHLARLVDDLFLLARIESGSYRLAVVEVDLAELADEAVEAVAPAAARDGVQVGVAATGPIRVDADPTALGRVLRNLLVNAIRHSPPGGEVTIELTQAGAIVETLVVDQGAGFPQSMRETAFDRFVRADDSRSRDTGGSGLGLSIAKGIVEAHGGTIEIADGPGGRVRFVLPAQSSFVLRTQGSQPRSAGLPTLG